VHKLIGYGKFTGGVASLQKLILELLGIISELRAENAELRGRLGLNSQNSSKPPSGDNYTKKVKLSLREKSGKKVGGQLGHEGTA